jgi:hypothetical protein
VFSDLHDHEQLLRLSERVGGAAADDVRLHRVRGPADNLAIVRLDAAPAPQSPLDWEVFAQVANFSSTARTAAVSLMAPDGVRERRRLALAPGERTPVIFTAPAAAWVEARLEDTGGDALAVDDHASLVLPARSVTVLHAGGGDRYVDAALRAHPRVRLRQIPVEQLRARQGSRPAADVAVLDGVAPPEDFALPALVFASAPDRRGTGSRAAPIVDWERNHPLLRQLDLSDVLVPGGAVLPADASGALIRSADGTVARATVAHGVRRVEFAFAVNRSNLGDVPAFPILVARAIDWLADRTTDGQQSVPAGQPLRMTLPHAASIDLAVRRPDGSTVRVTATEGQLHFPGTERTGRYEVEGPGIRSAFAVNLLDPDESNLDRPEAETADRPFPAIAALADRREFVYLFLALALSLLTVETWLRARPREGRS